MTRVLAECPVWLLEGVRILGLQMMSSWPDHISTAAMKISTSRGKVVVPREKKRQKEMVTFCPRVGGESRLRVKRFKHPAAFCYRACSRQDCCCCSLVTGWNSRAGVVRRPQPIDFRANVCSVAKEEKHLETFVSKGDWSIVTFQWAFIPIEILKALFVQSKINKKRSHGDGSVL